MACIAIFNPRHFEKRNQIKALLLPLGNVASLVGACVGFGLMPC